MPRFEQKDVSFDVPRHWRDKTLVAFSAPAKAGQTASASLVMTRDALGAGASLKAYGDEQLAELAQRVDGFELVAREETSIGGLPAISIRFTSKASAGPLEQRLVLVQGKLRNVYCFTATTPKADAEQNGPLFERILGSVRFATSEDAEVAE